MTKNEKISVLIPDGENPLLFNVLNCFSLAKEVDVYVMSIIKDSPFKHSRFVKQYSYYPKTETVLEWIANINDEIDRYDIDMVVPIFEKGIKALIEHKNRIASGKLVNLPVLENFDTAINKGLLSLHMDEKKIQSSNSVIVKPHKAFIPNGSIRFPVLAKPTMESGGGEGIVKFQNQKDLETFFIENKFGFDYLVEEFIEGYDICCNVLCENGDILAYTIHKGFMKGQKTFGPTVGLEFLDNDGLLKLVTRLMKSLKWDGVANLDLRYDQVSETFKVIEINTRFWYNVDASAVKGVNFPYLYVLNSLGKNFPIPKYSHGKYLNINGIVKSIKTSKRFIFNFRAIFKNSQLTFALRDPLPFVYRVFQKSSH